MGLDHLWIFGDNFCQNTVTTHFTSQKEENSYAKRNFEVSTITSNLFLSNERNIFTRWRNMLVMQTREVKPLPKMILFVPDDDIIRELKNYKSKTADYGRAIEWFMREFSRIIDSWKDFLPAKAKKAYWPHFIWIKPVRNVNFRNNGPRDAFGRELDARAQLFERTWAVDLEQLWEFDDVSLFLALQQRFTNEGKHVY